MKTLHLKSPCCQEKIYHYSSKRRKCSKCGKTWTIRPKKRGPKPIRRFTNPVMEVLSKNITLTNWATRHHLSIANASKQFRRHLKKSVSQPLRFTVPNGSYVVLGDALWFTFKKQDWTMFLIALKPVSENKAYFLDPVTLPGGESYENWTYALSKIPSDIKQQVKAFISDGFRSSRHIANDHGWVHQRCLFHIIAYLQLRRGARKRYIAGKSVREAIFQNVIKLLVEKSPSRTIKLLNNLKRLAKRPDCPKSLKMTIAEVLRSLSEFRAYLNYPNLHLPSTTGSIETMCKLIRKRVGTVRTVEALNLWAIALVRLKSPLTCNGKEH